MKDRKQVKKTAHMNSKKVWEVEKKWGAGWGAENSKENCIVIVIMITVFPTGVSYTATWTRIF